MMHTLSSFIRLFPRQVALIALVGSVGCGSHQVTRVDPESSKTEAVTESDAEKPTPPVTDTLPLSSATFREHAMNGNLEGVQKAIERGIDVNKVDEEGRSALMLASFDGHEEIVKQLLQHGADVQARDQAGRTALLYAASGPNAATVRSLLDAGSDINARDQGEGFTALMFAAAEGHADVVRVLLERGADTQIKDVDGEDALLFAKNNGHGAVVEVLTANAPK